MLSSARAFLRRHLAASEGCYKVVEWLLEEGADANFVDRFKRTPLEVPAVPRASTAAVVVALPSPYLT